MSTKILVADDSITIQKVIGIIFGGEEYSLTVVDNGKAAVDKARETSPDILLIDALMPGISGYEACEQIRAVPELAGKPILLMTGSFEPFDEARAQSCGANDFIAKPFEAQQIVTKVKELIASAPLRTTAPVAMAPAAPQAVVPPPQAQPVSEGFFGDLMPSAPPAFAVPAAEPAAPVFAAPVEPAFAAVAANETPLDAAFTAPVAPSFSSTSATDDIWGAFTSAAEPAPVAAVPDQATPAPPLEPDVFAIASEEPLLQSIPDVPQQNAEPVGTGWAQVEEQAFAFEDAPVSAAPPVSTAIPLQTVDDNAFGEISFADTFQPEPTPPAAPAAQTGFDVLEAMEPLSDFAGEPVMAAMAAVAPQAAVKPEPAPSAESETAIPQPAPIVMAAPPASMPAAELSEEQLKAAISAASKEVIERIVWEVVPDLAEAMIREAIRKIKEGV